MAQRGKKYMAASEGIDRQKVLSVDDAIDKVLGSACAEFDESIDIAVRLNVNPRHADQMVRGACVLPSGSGKESHVIVFAKGDKEKEASDAGADEVGAEDLAKKIEGGWFGFDKAIATPDMMSVVGKLGKILGPRGLMPNPKVGTVTQDVAQAVKDAKSGKIEFRVEKAGIVHCMIGKRSFKHDELKKNLVTLLENLLRLRPSTVKGTYIKSTTISTTMGPGIRMDHSEVEAMLKK